MARAKWPATSTQQACEERDPSEALVDSVQITVLVDNKASDGRVPEHGLSAWIAVEGRFLLFDTGQGPSLASLVGCPDTPIHAADSLILSHGHYDHTGGVPLVLENASAVHVYCHPDAISSRYSIHNGNVRQIGMPENSRLALARLPRERLHWIPEPLELLPGVGVTGPIPRLTAYEDVGGPFFVDPIGEHVDPIRDDLALWIRSSQGLVVVVGCCHSGLINTLRYVQDLSKTSRIRAVIGGFHLVESNFGRVASTIDALLQIDPDLIVPCHCTGERVTEQLRQSLGDRVQAGAVGARFCFGGS